jgi:hypothetical protein
MSASGSEAGAWILGSSVTRPGRAKMGSMLVCLCLEGLRRFSDTTASTRRLRFRHPPPPSFCGARGNLRITSDIRAASVRIAVTNSAVSGSAAMRAFGQERPSTSAQHRSHIEPRASFSYPMGDQLGNLACPYGTQPLDQDVSDEESARPLQWRK